MFFPNLRARQEFSIWIRPATALRFYAKQRPIPCNYKQYADRSPERRWMRNAGGRMV